VLQFGKEILSGLGLLILANIVVLGLVGVLKGSGVPKSVANPLQLAYLPLMWAGLRLLKRKYRIHSVFAALRMGSSAGRALLAGLLVGGMAALIIALLHGPCGMSISFELLTTEVHRWLFMALLPGATAMVEELLFRDYILHATLKMTQNLYAVAGLNAAIFLLLHFQGFVLGDYTPLWGVGVFAIGLCLAAYVLVFRDLVFPMCFHAFWNISTTLYVEDDKTFNLIKFDHYKVHELLISNVTAAVCIGVMLGLFGLLAHRYHRVAH
jgi:hypothetical protein